DDVFMLRVGLRVARRVQVGVATLGALVEGAARWALVEVALGAVVVAALRTVVVGRALGAGWAVVVGRTLRTLRAVTVSGPLSARRAITVGRTLVVVATTLLGGVSIRLLAALAAYSTAVAVVVRGTLGA